MTGPTTATMGVDGCKYAPYLHCMRESRLRCQEMLLNVVCVASVVDQDLLFICRVLNASRTLVAAKQ